MRNQFGRVFSFLLAIVPACGAPESGDEGFATAARETLSRPSSGLRLASFTVDNVPVTLLSRLPIGDFSASPAGAPRQIAWSIAHNPIRYVQVQVIPYGFGSPVDHNLVARPGVSTVHRQTWTMLHADKPAAAPRREITASLFGKSITGSAYVWHDDHATGGYQGMAHFTTEAGGRLWVVGVSEDLSSGDIGAFFNSLQDLSLTSSGLERATTLTHQPPSLSVTPEQPPPVDGSGHSAPGGIHTGSYHGQTIPRPYWWTDSPCDKTNFWNHTPPRVPAASLLTPGAHVPNPWNGLQACGPNPYLYGGAADVQVTFPGGWGELEFECVELSMRFLYGAYGVKAYGANGNSIANNYSTARGGGLQRIPNGGAPPLPVAGDVLQYRCGTFGHTSVVVSESHNASGTGGLYVIEQNNGPGAGNYLPETRWTVGCDSSGCCVDAWLHQP